MNNAVCGKISENVWKHRNVKPFTTERRKNYLISEPNYHTTKFFKENLLTIKMKTIQLLMNKYVYLGLLILEMSKVIMYEFLYDYVKLKYNLSI